MHFVFRCYDCTTENGPTEFTREEAIQHFTDTKPKKHNVRMELKEETS